ncbi:MAG: hypothetical protein PVH91_04555 [Pseudomonadales bacterium]|jgi:hypothetical protein
MGAEINRRCSARRAVTSWARWLILASLLAVRLVAWGEAAPEAVYRVTLSDDLREVQVEARLADPAPLAAPEGDVRELSELRGCNDEPVSIRRDRILTDSAGGCIRYAYALRPQSGRRAPPVAPGVVISTPGAWLWTPEMRIGSAIRIELSAPTAMAVSVPWRPMNPGVFELTPSPGSATGSAVFGRFDAFEVGVPGGRLRVAAVDGPDHRLDAGKVRHWLHTAAMDVAGVGGRFPNPDLQVIVQPVDAHGRSPVPFGYVIRDGGEAVRFFVAPDRPLSDLESDWTATHEFSHLLLPYVRSSEKWVSEGFASYYQNVLLARRGVYTATGAWRRLSRGFERAADIRNPPRLDQLDDRPFWDVRMLIYWSGAAMALKADVELRDRHGSSLDAVLGRLAECCLPSERTWTAEALFAKLDELAPAPVFMPLYHRLMAERGMPDLTGLYADLGIVPGADGVRLTGAGRLVGVRDAIMRPEGDARRKHGDL